MESDKLNIDHPKDAFIDKLTRIVLDNLQNEQFGVSVLAKEVGYSRSHLHRKLQAHSSLSISQFIRAIRLNEALRLLQEDELTAAETAYRVGYNNPSYFSTCFHQYYGFTPGEAKRRIAKKTAGQHPVTLFPKGHDDPDKPAGILIKQAGKRSDKKWFIYLPAMVLFAAIIGILSRVYLFGTGRDESMMVLPPDNETGLSEFDYFFSGIHTILIGELGQLKDLRVISKQSSKALKDEGTSLGAIAREYKINSFLEPSVYCFGDSICLQITLIRAKPREEVVWVENFKLAKDEILNFQHEITRVVAQEIRIELSEQEQRLLSEVRQVDTAALDAYFRALNYLDKFTRSAIDSAEFYFHIARVRDPGWALPYSGLAKVAVYKAQMGYISPANSLSGTYSWFTKALSIDPYSPDAHYMKAILAVWTEWDWETGEKEFLRALELNPNDALCRMFYAHFLMIMNRGREALNQASHALELDPLRPLILSLYAKVAMNEKKYKLAWEAIEKALSLDPENHILQISLSQYCKVTGDYDRWFRIWTKRRQHWDEQILTSMEKTYHQQGYQATVRKIIELHRQNEDSANNLTFAHWHLQIGEYEKAIDYIYRAYEARNHNIPYTCTRRYDSHILKDYPAYVELMDRLGLPIQD